MTYISTPVQKTRGRSNYSERKDFFQCIFLYNSCMECEYCFYIKMHFHHLMLSYFQKNDIQTAKKICAIYGDGTIAESTVCKWFARLGCGNSDLEDRECSGRPAVTDDGQIEM